MRIALLTSQQVPSSQSVTRDCLTLLASWGASVDVLHHEEGLTDLVHLPVEHDLYLLKSPSPDAVSLAAALEARGALCLNRPAMLWACHDRIHTTALLAAAGVPVPRTWTTKNAAELAGLLDDGPLVIKTAALDRSAGARVIWDADEIVDLPHEAVLAQQFHPSDHRDRKLYRIGSQTFGVKRSWPATSYESTVGEPFAVTPEMREITDRVGAAFNSDLFGLDLVEAEEGLLVVDVHPFPGFKGVPDAALRLADYIYARGKEALECPPN
ncbi:MAG: hypothetical protein Q4B08_03595 [Propionibacteriaceae bacterium]|nr:hypothetical protein [Propionibacteriaceae bacterium]